MSDRNYCLYVHKNRINGKKYIGITNNITKRWYGKGKRYEELPAFGAAIKKYGWDAFAHIILLTDMTLEEASQAEIEYIKRHRTQEKAYGYNVACGGTHAPSMLGRHHSEETKKKMRAAQLGKKKSEEEKKRHSEFMTGLLVGSRNGKSTAVRCINTGEVFECQRAAAKATGCDQSKISLCCNGKRKHTKGYRWEFVR